MLKYDVRKTVVAVQFLVDDSFYTRHVRRIYSCVERPKTLPFRGSSECLNELIIVGRQSKDALGSLLALADFKRDTHNDYQREFMATKRKRQARYITITEKTNKTQLSLTERRHLLIDQQKVWDAQRDEYVATNSALYKEKYGEEAGWTQMNAMKREFWMVLDAQLEVMQEDADHLYVPKKREVILVKETTATKITSMQKAFSAIVDKRK